MPPTDAGPAEGEAIEVHAAGAVVWRPAADGAAEVLLVHRPRYDDWTVPKGKRDPGESDEACAVREVAEETGLRGRLGAELPSTTYVDHRGRSKRVRYWAMLADGGDFVANDEVDAVRWVSPGEARRLLTYPRDVPVVDALFATL